MNLLTNPLGTILDGTLSLLVTVNALLGQLFNAVGWALRWVLSLEITTQLTVVGIAWTSIRDMVNLVFIVLFIGIAFGTIFNALGFFKGWHYSSALMPLIIAAMLMNFSLAIGKAIALVSNQATKSVLGVIGDPGAILIESLKPNSLVIGSSIGNALTALKAPITDTTATRTEAENKRYLECLKEEKTVVDANVGLWRYAIRFMKDLPSTKVRKTIGDCNLEINDARYHTTPAAVAQAGAMNEKERLSAAISEGSVTDKLMLIASALFNSLMILMLISCLASAFIFLALRIIVVWVLLATAALAWISYAIPGNREGWHKWWKHMIAWNVFAPLYLLSLIPGLVMLGGSAEMMAQLKAAGGDIGTAGMLIQQFFFYAFAVLIFVGGLALSLKSSFATTVKGTEMVGGFASKLGVFDTAGFGAKATGMTARYEGAKAGVSALYKEKITTPLARREEELTARYQARFGDRRAREVLEQKRITEQFNKNKEAGLSVADLKSDLGKVGTPKYFAAAKALLEAGELDANQMDTYVTAASRVSPSFGRVAQEAAEKKLKELSKEKKFKNAEDVGKALAYYGDKPSSDDKTVKENKKRRDAILKSLEENQPLIAAEMAKEGHYFNPDGSKATAADVLERNTKGLDSDAWAKILEKDRKGEMTLTPNLQRILAERTKKTGDYLALAGRVKNKEDQVALAHISALDEQIQRAKAAKKGKKRSQTP
ncbi:MAG: hypothetical protein AAB375_01540 [Patescibacteria group bacterium]